MAQYADIVNVDVVSEQSPEVSTYFTADLKNLYTSVVSMRLLGWFLYDSDVQPVTWDWEGYNIPPGAIFRFIGNFIMPNSPGRLHIVSYWYGGDGFHWYADDEVYVDVALAEALLAEIKDIWYWDANIGHFIMEPSEPPTISIGDEAGAQFNVYNISDGYLDLGLFITAFDPLGNQLAVDIAGPSHLAPGESFGSWYRVVTKLPGTYTFTVDIITSALLPYGIIGTLENVPVAYVVGEIPSLAGHVYSPMVYDSTTGEAFYSLSLPVEIVGGHEVIVGIHWMNDGSQTATFTSTFELVDPDGIAREVQIFNTVLSPTEHTGGQTGSSVELDKVGMWKIHATLKAGGTLLDEETWDAIGVAVLPTEGAVQIISVTPYVVR